MKRFDVSKLVEINEVDELKKQINELLLMLREGETFELADHDEVITRVKPESAQKQSVRRDSSEAWKNLERLSAELSARWPKDVSAVDAVRDVRRDL